MSASGQLAVLGVGTTRLGTNPLDVKLRWLPLVIKPVAVDAALVNLVQLTLKIVQVRLA